MRVVDAVDVGGLSRWEHAGEEAAGPDYAALGGPAPRHPHTPFPTDRTINNKLILWQGDISLLEVDAITNSTNETLDERNLISERIFSRAGSGLQEEVVLRGKECRTGEVQVTSGHGLCARHILHSVGPQYSPRYHTAAESTLHVCYRNILHKACELGARTLAVCLVHSVRRNFPPDLGVHVALRTVRRFLERGVGSVECVVLCAATGCDASLLEALTPLYFPRGTGEERLARYQLPADTGGPLGEPVLPDRQIRITDNPQHSVMDADDDSVELEGLGGGFGQMQGDLDRERLLGERRITLDPLIEVRARQIEHQERYERLLRRAKTEDLSEISGIGCLYQSGVDKLGRPVVVFTGKWFPFATMNLDKALLYLVQLLDPIVKGDYVIAYFHTLTSTTNYPSFSWLKEVYGVLPYKYKKNLKAFYIVHPTIWTKMMTWWFTTFMAPAIKQKVHNLPGVEYLYSVMDRDQLEIPAYITEYDMTINGLHYFQPYSTGS